MELTPTDKERGPLGEYQVGLSQREKGVSSGLEPRAAQHAPPGGDGGRGVPLRQAVGKWSGEHRRKEGHRQIPGQKKEGEINMHERGREIWR